VNIQEYISSGIIESYVLGLASRQDAEEFERLCAAHQELLAARDAFEKELENQLLLGQVAPPQELKSSLFSRMGMEKVAHSSDVAEKPSRVRRIGFPRMVAAASVILLLGSVLLNLYLLRQYKHTIAQYQNLLASQTQLVNANESLNTKLDQDEEAIGHMKDPRMAIVKMAGIPTSPAPSSLATVYWNTESKEVYLLVNQLPVPVAGKQYQLWAIVDGKPVDAGIFDIAERTHFMKLKTIPHAQAFAITLEKRGGSVSPTMDALYVMGKVTG
jgi:anti-sigma-K factor RskA